jgi:hypothetical protein
MVPAKAEDAIAGEKIEIFRPFYIPQIRTFSANITTVETNGLEGANVGGIDMLGVEFIVTTLVFLNESTNVQTGRFASNNFSLHFHISLNFASSFAMRFPEDKHVG